MISGGTASLHCARTSNGAYKTSSRFCDKRYLISNSLVRLLAFYSVRCFNGLSKQETQFREWSVESLIQRQEKER